MLEVGFLLNDDVRGKAETRAIEHDGACLIEDLNRVRYKIHTPKYTHVTKLCLVCKSFHTSVVQIRVIVF